jgi:hypothetical protein
VYGAVWCGSWRVPRRFSQFVELHAELWARHTAALQRSAATLPGKWRLPFGGLELEGRERAPELHAYLQALMANDELRSSEQLVYFLAANTPARRREWEAATRR